MCQLFEQSVLENLQPNRQLVGFGLIRYSARIVPFTIQDSNNLFPFVDFRLYL